jgi:hypothetical protein
MTEHRTAPENEPRLDVETPENPAVEIKRSWNTPTFEELDYTVTSATVSGIGGDNTFYSG